MAALNSPPGGTQPYSPETLGVRMSFVTFLGSSGGERYGLTSGSGLGLTTVGGDGSGSEVPSRLIERKAATPNNTTVITVVRTVFVLFVICIGFPHGVVSSS